MTTVGRVQSVILVDENNDPVSGSPDDAAYTDGTGAADGSQIALLKGIYKELVAQTALLTTIASNTAPA